MCRKILFWFFLLSIPFIISAQIKQEIIDQVKLVLTAQEEAWNSNDLISFMDGYWNSENLVFVGSKGLTYGWKQTLENYQKGYPTAEAMGKLHFDIHNVEVWDEKTVHMIGKFTLKRKADQPEGYFSLLWRKIGGQWRIVSDHSSASGEE